MRKRILMALVCGLLAAGTSRAQDARGILDRAIQTHGGSAAIDRFKAAQTHTKGVMVVSGQEVPFTQEILFDMPGRFREVLSLEAGGKKAVLTTVYNGQAGWIDDGSQTHALEGRRLEEVRESVYVARIARLTSLRAGPYRLSPLEPAEVAGRPALGLRVHADGHRDVDLFFDRDRGLLLKVRRVVADVRTGKEVTEERFLSDYRDVQGIKSARHVRLERDGERLMELDITDVKFLDRLDDNTFAHP